MVVAQRRTGVHAGDHDVEEPVVVEVVHHDAARPPGRVEAHRARRVREGAGIVRGFQRGRRHEQVGGHVLRVAAERHVRDVEEPAHLEVAGVAAEVLPEVLDGGRGPGGLVVLAGSADGEDAARGIVVVHAVLELAPPELEDAEHGLQRRARAHERRIRGRILRHDAIGRLHLCDGAVHPAVVGEELAELLMRMGDGREVAAGGRRRLQPREVALRRGEGGRPRLLARVADLLEIRSRRRDVEEARDLGAARDLHHDLVVAGARRTPVPVALVGDALRGRPALAARRRHHDEDGGRRHAGPLQAHEKGF